MTTIVSDGRTASGMVGSVPGFADYTTFDATSLADLVRRKEVAPVEIVDAMIAAAEKVQPRLNCLVTPLFERARDQARRLELDDSPFAGLPILLKDLAGHIAGVRNTSGSRYEKDVVARQDAELTVRFKRAGFIPAGTTTSPELGLLPVTESELHGPTQNPWKHGRTAGGSSGGAGAAVAARIVPVAHGSDGGGSIRVPASCCGVFGIKPTRARTPQGPVTTERWHGFVSGHVLTRSVRDSATVLDAVHGAEPGAPYHVLPPQRPYAEEVRTDPGKLRIAFTTRPFLPGEVHEDCRQAVADAASLCESLGHYVEERNLDFLDPASLAHAFFTIVASETAAYYDLAAIEHGRRPARGELELTTVLTDMMGRNFTGADVCRSMRQLRAVGQQVAAFHERWDVLLCPTVGRPPPPHYALRPVGLEAAAQRLVAAGRLSPVLRLPGLVETAVARVFQFIPFPPLANVTGQPSMSMPLWWNADDLPIGTMFTGRFGDEATLFRLAAQLEAERPWADRRPPVCA